MNLFTQQQKSLLEQRFNHFHFYDEIDSTNEKCKWLCRCDKTQEWIVLADRQTKGRGRYGRTWESQPHKNVYMSFAMKNIFKNDIAQLNLYLGVMLFKSIRSLYPHIQNLTTKWPNDLYVGKKKVAGILIENVDNMLEWVVVGMGINVHASIEDIPDTATSLTLEINNFPLHARGKIVNEILKNIYFGSVEKNYIELFWECSKKTQSEEYTYTKQNKVYKGVLQKIHPDGSILIETAGGMEIIY